VIVSFSEIIADFPNPEFNYAVDNGIPVSAVLDSTGTNVTLTLGTPMTPGTLHDLFVNSIQDLNGLTLDATNISFRAWAPGPLTITIQGSTVRVSWPLPGTGMTLQETTTLSGNPPPWQDVPAANYYPDATSMYIEVPATGTRFYRLRQP